MLRSKAIAALLGTALAGTPQPRLPRIHPQSAPHQVSETEDLLRCATARLVIRQQPKVEGRLHEAILETGTAFFIDSMGDMLTAAHVYFGVPPLREGWVERRTLLFDTGGRPYELPVPTASESHQQAQLDVVKFPTNLRPPCYLNLAASKSLITGAPLQTFGFPNDPEAADHDPHEHAPYEDHHSRRGYFQLGKLLDEGAFPDGRPMLRANFFGREGMSGSPICTLAGDVVGVLLFKEHNGHSYVFAVPAEELSGLD